MHELQNENVFHEPDSSLLQSSVKMIKVIGSTQGYYIWEETVWMNCLAGIPLREVKCNVEIQLVISLLA